MNVMTILLQAAPAQGGGMTFMIMMVAIFAIMYFFIIRPQQKKKKQNQNFQKSETPGREVITQGGIYGTVSRIDEQNNILYIEIAKGVQIKVHRTAVYPNAADTTHQK